VALVLAAPAIGAELAEGHWRLAQTPSANFDVSVFLLKVEKKDGKTVGEVADLPARSTAKLDSFKVEGDKVVVVVAIGINKLTFEGTIDPKDEKVVWGSYGDDRRISRALLV